MIATRRKFSAGSVKKLMPIIGVNFWIFNPLFRAVIATEIDLSPRFHQNRHIPI